MSEFEDKLTGALRECPFCGATAPTVHLSRDRDDKDMAWQYQIVCNYNLCGCGASGCYSDSPKNAIAAWNRRAEKVPSAQRCSTSSYDCFAIAEKRKDDGHNR